MIIDRFLKNLRNIEQKLFLEENSEEVAVPSYGFKFVIIVSENLKYATHNS